LKPLNIALMVAAIAVEAALVLGIYEFAIRQADESTPDYWTAESRDATWERVKSGADILARSNPVFSTGASCVERGLRGVQCAEDIIVNGWRRECVLRVIEKEYPNPQDVDDLEDKRLMEEVKRLVTDECP
jgi:hypothetical protein